MVNPARYIPSLFRWRPHSMELLYSMQCLLTLLSAPAAVHSLEAKTATKQIRCLVIPYSGNAWLLYSVL